MDDEYENNLVDEILQAGLAPEDSISEQTSLMTSGRTVTELT